MADQKRLLPVGKTFKMFGIMNEETGMCIRGNKSAFRYRPFPWVFPTWDTAQRLDVVSRQDLVNIIHSNRQRSSEIT